ncbi:hypothetical protein [Mycobacterium leprae]|uniref:hypothetical protein n=1 Tax=Mycobacterium leprae TaxID=1769 RepID=UPI0002E09FBB|nr:hypothetical protein [Mycobacterium leprae]
MPKLVGTAIFANAAFPAVVAPEAPTTSLATTAGATVPSVCSSGTVVGMVVPTHQAVVADLLDAIH